MTWTPILSGDEQKRALEIVGTIAEDLRARFGVSAEVGANEAWSVASGRSGVALFFAYLGEALHDDSALALAGRLVEESLDSAAGMASFEHLFEGVTGVAWTLAHVDGWLLDLSEGDPNDAVDAALLDLLTTTPWPGEYDLVAGLAGIGVYALERLPRPAAAEALVTVVARLSELAERDPHHPFWWTPSERLPAHIMRGFPNGAWNLGAAHGAPGVIALLARACAAGIADAKPLLDGAVDWLLDQQLPAVVGSAFPSFVAPDVVARRSPLAWCYGDPGVAGALFMAARQADVPGWGRAAVAIAEQAAGRPVADSGVVDASICHGSAGLAHIFNRLCQSTGSAALRGAAERWLEQLLSRLQSDPEEGRWPSEAGFLAGTAGIGLVLLAAATPLEPRWDRLYLLS